MNLAQLILEDKITTLFDSEHRPVSEPTASHRELVLCPYQDRRHNLPMNRAGLEQVGRHWADILQWVSPRQQEKTSLRDSLSVALLAAVEPLLFHLENPSLPVPASVSARYKACLGFCQILIFLLWNEKEPATAKLADYGTEEEFFLWLDSEAWLLGKEQVCSGPQSMIQELFRRFCYARPRPEHRETVERVLELIALQFTYILCNHKNGGSLAQQMLNQGQSPWLFALAHNPRRDYNDVLKLLHQGQASPKLEELMGSPNDEDLFLRLFLGA